MWIITKVYGQSVKKLTFIARKINIELQIVRTVQ